MIPPQHSQNARREKETFIVGMRSHDQQMLRLLQRGRQEPGITADQIRYDPLQDERQQQDHDSDAKDPTPSASRNSADEPGQGGSKHRGGGRLSGMHKW